MTIKIKRLKLRRSPPNAGDNQTLVIHNWEKPRLRKDKED